MTIKVVCCSPDKIRDKLICKGGKTIKSIEIIVPEKTKPPPEKTKPPPEKPKPPPEKLTPPPAAPEPAPDKPKDSRTPPVTPTPPTTVVGYPIFSPVYGPPPPPTGPAPRPRPPPTGPAPEKPTPQPATPKPPYPDLGHGGPCHHGYGIPYQRPSSCDGYVRQVPSYDEPYGGWPSGCRCNRSYGCRCEYFTEENPACTIM